MNHPDLRGRKGLGSEASHGEGQGGLLGGVDRSGTGTGPPSLLKVD